MCRNTAVLASVLLVAALLTAPATALRDEEQCNACKQLVNATREELKQHAGDAKDFLLTACDSSPALFKATCQQVATSVGDSIEKLLKQAYEQITEENMCTMVCGPQPSVNGDGSAGADPLHQLLQSRQRLVQEVQSELLSATSALHAIMMPDALQQQQQQQQVGASPLCETCKSSVSKAKDWIKQHQTDVRDFMYKKCEEMTDIDLQKCRDTADKVADNIEAALQAIYDQLDESVVCSLFCPPPPAPPSADDILRRATGAFKKFFGSFEA